MDVLDRLMIRWQRRVRWQRVLDTVGPCTGWSWAAGAGAVLVVRAAVPDGGWLVWPLLTTALLAPAVVIPGAWRTTDPAWRLAGDIDRRAQADGVLMAAVAHPAQREAWQERLAPAVARAVPPAWSWRAWRWVPAALLALVGAWMLPQVAATPAPQGSGAAFIAPVAAQVHALRDQGLAPEPELARLDDELKRLSDAALQNGLDPLRWEALDRLQRTAGDLAMRADQRLGETLAAAEAAADADGQHDAAAALTRAGDLAATLAALANDAPGLARLDAATLDAVAAAAQAAAAAGQLDPATAQRLCALAQRTASSGTCKNLGNAACRIATDLAARRAALVALGTCRKSGSCSNPVLAPGTGNGGVDRGPGHAELERVDRAPVDIGAADGLPPGARVDPDGSVTFATTVRDPRAEDVAAAARAAARAFDPAAADARRVQIPPRHRAAVAAYFDAATPPVVMPSQPAPTPAAPRRPSATDGVP